MQSPRCEVRAGPALHWHLSGGNNELEIETFGRQLCCKKRERLSLAFRFHSHTVSVLR